MNWDFPYRVWGNSHKTHPVFCFHGFLGSKNDWGFLGRELANRRQVLAIDFPGHGQNRLTEAPKPTAGTRFIDALADFLENKASLPCHGIGYSMGGRLLLQLATRRPELFKSMVLISTTAGLTERERIERRKWEARLARQLREEDFQLFLEKWYRQPLFRTLAKRPSVIRRLLQIRAKNDPAQLAMVLPMLGSGNWPGVWSKLPQLRLPVMLIAGEKDERYVELAKRMLAELPTAQLEVIPTCSHAPQVEQPLLVADLVERFLDKVECCS